MKYLLLLLMCSSAFAATNAELERKIDILADEIAQLKASQQNIGTGQMAYGLGQAASKVYFINQGLSIGGYGEIVYTNQASEDEDGNVTNREPEAEALRNIIYVGYKFNDKWLVNIELEMEHVNEIYTEFMYVDYLASDALSYRFGLSLVPMGLINELHEPIYFNSVKRPEIETYLIPSTWREIGVGAFGALGPEGKFTYKAFLYNGPDADDIAANTSKGIRSGRKKGGSDNSNDNQNASTYAAVLRGDYNFDASTSVGGSLFTGQGSSLNSTNNYIDMDLSFSTPIELDQEVEVGSGPTAQTATVNNANVAFGMKSAITTIPIEASTYLRFLYVFTAFGGLGMDITTGSTDVNLESSGDLILTSQSNASLGDISLDDTSSGDPNSFGFRAFAGLQLNLPFFRLYGQVQKPLGQDTLGTNFGLKVLW